MLQPLRPLCLNSGRGRLLIVYSRVPFLLGCTQQMFLTAVGDRTLEVHFTLLGETVHADFIPSDEAHIEQRLPRMGPDAQWHRGDTVHPLVLVPRRLALGVADGLFCQQTFLANLKHMQLAPERSPWFPARNERFSSPSKSTST